MPPATVSARLSSLRFAGPLAGARSGAAADGGGRAVRLGIWREGGRVVRARYRATSCASLIAYAEAACELIEAGCDPTRLDADALRAAVTGVHPLHRSRADLVASAARRAGTSLEEELT